MIDRRRFTKGLLIGMGAAAFGQTAAAAQDDANGGTICTLLVDAEDGRIIFREGDSQQRCSPCSTFKLPIAIMGFDAGVLSDTQHPRWDYRPEFNAHNDRDKKPVDPTVWLRDSVVWYSQQITQRIGMERFRAYVEEFDYGNKDVSGNPGKDDGLTQAWLMSSLQISVDEQVRFISRFLQRALPVSDTAYGMTTASLPVFPAEGGWTVHGKTGSGWLRDTAGRFDKSRPLGWFVGWAEKDERGLVFARQQIGTRRSDKPGGFLARAALLAGLAKMADAS